MDSPEGTINYGYEVATGRLARTWTDSSETAYSYDKLGRLEMVKVVKRNGGPVSEETRYTYTKVGSRETVTLPNGVVTAYQYDCLNRLTNLTHKLGGTNLLASFSYKLHETGRRTNAVEIIKTADTQTPWITNNLNWQFDGMYRLTNETSSSTLASGCYTNSFVYDKVGNRLQKQHVSGNTTTIVDYSYNPSDQLTNEVARIKGTPSGTNSYVFDLNGSLTSKTENGSTTVYTYNLANKLSSVAADGATNAFLYNDNGIRVQTRSATGTTTRYLIDGNNHTGYAQVLGETASGGALVKSYVIGDDVLGQGGSDTNSIRWLLYDGHGSTRQLVSSTPQITGQFNYSAYGEALGEQFTPTDRPETSLLYCGEQFDVNLQMYNLRARYYIPASGTFNQRDTFAGNNCDPQSLHKYAFCHDDPVNGIDPSGNSLILHFTMSALIIGVVAGLIAGAISGAFTYAKTKSFKAALYSAAVTFAAVSLSFISPLAAGIFLVVAGISVAVKIANGDFSKMDAAEIILMILAIIATKKVMDTYVFTPIPSTPPPIAAPLAFRIKQADDGLTGVYDTATGEVNVRPSTYDPGPLPEGYVPARRGHRPVSAELGGDPQGHRGFALIKSENGSLTITWRSRTLNSSYPNAEVPVELRPKIIKAVEEATGFEVQDGGVDNAPQ